MTSMNGQDKAGEPSMEEILASIRKIIAEEPGPGPLEADAPHPFAKSSPAGGPRAQSPFPLSGNRPLPSMDRLSNAIKAKAGPPASAPPPRRPVPLDDEVADLIEVPAPKAAAPPAASPALDARAPSAAPSEPAAKEAAPKPAAERPAPPIPMRKPGFFPPPGFMPLPQSVVEAITPPPPGPIGEDEVLSELTEAVEVVEVVAEPVRRPMPASAAPASAANRSSLNGHAARIAAELGAVAAPYNGMRREPQAPIDAVIDEGAVATAAAARALDALAQGLAASHPAEPPYGAARHQRPSPFAALVAQPLMPAPNDLGPAPVRTLEDAVADMLKPMLQRWLADNMPRIIERALSIEASRGGRDRG